MPSIVLLGMLAIAEIAQAQSYPVEMIITSTEVDVRSGPTKEYLPTSKLHYGDHVWVQYESKEPGYLAITPPRGSFSWINAKQVKQIDLQSGYVDVEAGAIVRPGSVGSTKVPNVESVKIPQGAQITILGAAVASDGNNWLPIQSWHSEVRYIPGEAVQTRQFAGAVKQSPAIPGQLTSLQSPPSTSQAPGHPAQMTQSASWSPVGQTASFSQANNAPRKLIYPPTWSQVGILRRALADKDGQPTYVLEDARGRVLLYATCQPGMTLRDYVGRTVALYGSINYLADDYLRTHFMTASHVAVY
jgi:hypothetical protein